MRVRHDHILFAATDVANHLSCPHLTQLNLRLARGEVAEPAWDNPHAVVLQQRGMEHEEAYLNSLRARGLSIVNLLGSDMSTLDAMQSGVDVIFQAALASGEWGGRTDVMLKVDRPCKLGSWSYEVVDCKLASETHAESVLQLCLYSELLTELQGLQPEFFHVMRPGVDFQPESYRFSSFAAYYRLVKASLKSAVQSTRTSYPEPVNHCEVCRWWKTCDQQRRKDDHLSFVAGASKLQRKELGLHGVETLQALAQLPLPIPFQPTRGARASFARIREQARIQFEARSQGRLKYELLDCGPGNGMYRLPAPSAGDIFLDFEGDPFVPDGGREYLFGVVAGGAYHSRWALDRGQERAAFEWLIEFTFQRLALHPELHIYHFGAYEQAAIKRLMLRYATKEEEVDRLLRGEILVDLHQIAKQSVRASVEQYSLKDLEKFCAFERTVPLAEASRARHFVEHQLEMHATPQFNANMQATVEGYNQDDCRATEALRGWLESLRSAAIPRPAPKDSTPHDKVSAIQVRVKALFDALTADVPAEPDERTVEQSARWLLAHALDWHGREDKVKWWELYRMQDLSQEELTAHKSALAGLTYVERLPLSGRESTPTDRYRFPSQDYSIKPGSDLYTLDVQKCGKVIAIDREAGLIDIKKPKKLAGLHPEIVLAHRNYDTKAQREAILSLGDWVVANGIDAAGEHRAARDLLLRKPPLLVLPIQGPPGSGKTHRGARMIRERVAQGCRVGVTAVSHKVIEHLLHEVGPTVSCAHKREGDGIASPDEALQLLQSGKVQVLGGTSFLWANAKFRDSVDVLFVDEAGQMSLANVLACAPAAANLVLLGDPQQLEQPQKGSHPEGSDISALAHLLNGRKTIEPDRGIFLEETWRLHPAICSFTSELFYEGRLKSRAGLDRQSLRAPAFEGAGLWFLPVEHSGNQSDSPEEVACVADIVMSLVQQGNTWVDCEGVSQPLTLDQVLIVAPYNDQVNLLKERLPAANIGTVDKFQGQQAAVVIYSLTTSTPEDAPHGMEFLYNENRFNVATSRARCACIVVGSSRLFAPECRTPRQMELANVLCRYAELSYAQIDAAVAARV